MPHLSRRDLLKLSAAGVATTSLSGWLGTLAADTAANPQRKRSCILLWMNGGPSQMDTFDLKPGHANGGPFRSIETSAPGLRISEHLPNVARYGHRMAVVRGMSTKEADHGRATFVMRTGYNSTGPIQYPGIGALLSKELGATDAPLPNCVAIAPYRFFNAAAYGPGFLGPQYAPLIVGDNVQFQQPGQPNQQTELDYGKLLRVQDLDAPEEVGPDHADARLKLLQEMESDFVGRHPGVAPRSHQTAYDRAVRLMRTTAAKAFNLDEEPSAVRDAYGRSLFGQGCLLARRLVERGVPFVEVTLAGDNGAGWDTHAQNFDVVRLLSQVLDPAWGALMNDLEVRPARFDAHRLDGRVWPHAENQSAARPRSLPDRMEHRSGGRRHSWRSGRRQDQPRRHGGRGTTDHRAGFPRHGLPCLGDRPTQAEHLQRRPTHPHRRQNGRTNSGGAGMTGRLCKSAATTLVLALLAIVPAAMTADGPARNADPGGADDVQDLVYFTEGSPVCFPPPSDHRRTTARCRMGKADSESL